MFHLYSNAVHVTHSDSIFLLVHPYISLIYPGPGPLAPGPAPGHAAPISVLTLGLCLLAFHQTYSDSFRLTSRTEASGIIFPIHPPLVSHKFLKRHGSIVC